MVTIIIVTVVFEVAIATYGWAKGLIGCSWSKPLFV